MQIETTEYRNKAERCISELAEIERQRQSLEKKLHKVQQERDTIADSNGQLRVEHKKVKRQLIDLGLQHEAAIELAESLSASQEKRHNEKQALEQKLEQVENELELVKIQVRNCVDYSTQLHMSHTNHYTM